MYIFKYKKLIIDMKNDSKLPYTPRDVDHPDYFGDFSWPKVIGLGLCFLIAIFIIGISI